MTPKVEQNPKKTMARDDTRRHGKAREDTTRHGKAREGTARHEKARARGMRTRGTRAQNISYSHKCISPICPWFNKGNECTMNFEG